MDCVCRLFALVRCTRYFASGLTDFRFCVSDCGLRLGWLGGRGRCLERRFADYGRSTVRRPGALPKRWCIRTHTEKFDRRWGCKRRGLSHREKMESPPSPRPPVAFSVHALVYTCMSSLMHMVPLTCDSWVLFSFRSL